jgi:hypothetical protein
VLSSIYNSEKDLGDGWYRIGNVDDKEELRDVMQEEILGILK